MRDGTIDVFATDHAPHALDEKAQLLSRGAGRVQRFGDGAGRVRARLPDLPLERFVALLSCNPARILGVPGGTLAVGLARRHHGVRRPRRGQSTRARSIPGKNTPFDGMTFPRRALATIVDGRIVIRDGTVNARENLLA